MDQFTSRVLIVFNTGSGSLGFNRERSALPPAGGNFQEAFMYSIGNPAANAFSATISNGGTVSVSPSVPRTQRQRQGGSPSEMEDIPPGELQSGSVSGTVPVNQGTSSVEHTLELTMTQP